MKIEIEIEEHNFGMSFSDDSGNMLKFEDMSYGEQVKILNAFAQGYIFWKRFLKEEKK